MSCEWKKTRRDSNTTSKTVRHTCKLTHIWIRKYFSVLHFAFSLARCPRMLRSFEISFEKNVCHTHTAAFDEITKKFGCVHFLGETKISVNWRQQSAVRKWCGRKFTRASLFALQVRTSSGAWRWKTNFCLLRFQGSFCRFFLLLRLHMFRNIKKRESV